MQFYDISLNLDSKTIAWPGDVRFSRAENRHARHRKHELAQALRAGSSGITSKLEMSTHTGTHIDAPRHFLFDKSGVDKIDLRKLIGPCRVIEIKSQNSKIKMTDLKFKISKGDRILFKTRNSALYKKGKFTADYVSLSLDGAKFLVRKKISLVGTDYFGIEAKAAPGHPVHKTLLRAGIVNVEGLDLSKVKPGKYNLAALPLRIVGSDGSPCRAILWK